MVDSEKATPPRSVARECVQPRGRLLAGAIRLCLVLALFGAWAGVGGGCAAEEEEPKGPVTVHVSEECTGTRCGLDSDCAAGERCNLALPEPACQRLECGEVGSICGNCNSSDSNCEEPRLPIESALCAQGLDCIPLGSLAVCSQDRPGLGDVCDQRGDLSVDPCPDGSFCSNGAEGEPVRLGSVAPTCVRNGTLGVGAECERDSQCADSNSCLEGICSEVPSEVAILLIIDNSSDMCPMQQDLLAVADTLGRSVASLGVDYRIGVTTTDMSATGERGALRSTPGEYPESCTGAAPTGCDSGAPTIATNADPADLASWLSCSLAVGVKTVGAGFERGLDAALVAAPTLLAGDRDVALLIVLFSSEDDCSHGDTLTMARTDECFDNSRALLDVTDTAPALAALTDLVGVLAIVGSPEGDPEVPYCRVDTEDVFPGYRYHSFVAEFGELGDARDICTRDGTSYVDALVSLASRLTH